MRWLRRLLHRRRDAARLLDVLTHGWARPGMVRRPCSQCGRVHWNGGDVSLPTCRDCLAGWLADD